MELKEIHKHIYTLKISENKLILKYGDPKWNC